MRTNRRETIGWIFVILGISVVVLSNKIVFPGLENLVGIETIVGAENVVYEVDGSYSFTNPDAAMIWIVSVAMTGFVLSGVGVYLLRKK